jgi:hypothetical protein
VRSVRELQQLSSVCAQQTLSVYLIAVTAQLCACQSLADNTARSYHTLDFDCLLMPWRTFTAVREHRRGQEDHRAGVQAYQQALHL